MTKEEILNVLQNSSCIPDIVVLLRIVDENILRGILQEYKYYEKHDGKYSLIKCNLGREIRLVVKRNFGKIFICHADNHWDDTYSKGKMIIAILNNDSGVGNIVSGEYDFSNE